MEKFRSRLLGLLFFNLMAFLLQAQNTVTVSVLIPPPYAPYVYDYKGKLIISLKNNSNQIQQIKLIGSIDGDNGLHIYTTEPYLPPQPIVLPAGGFLNILATDPSRQFLDQNHVDIQGPQELTKKILNTGYLPEGMYTICVQAQDYLTGMPLSSGAPLGCATIPVIYINPPALINPCNMPVDNTTGLLPTFQWTPPVGNSGPALFIYDFYLVKVFAGQNPNDAIAAARDAGVGEFILKGALFNNFYTLLPTDKLGFLEPGQLYAWTVIAEDKNHKVGIENDGQSEICTFIYGLGTNPGEDSNKEKEAQKKLTDTKVKGRLMYKYPQTEVVSNKGSEYNVEPSLSVPYASFLNPEPGKQSAVYNQDINYLLANQIPFGPATGSQSADKKSKDQLKNNYSISAAGGNPLANTTVHLRIQMVIKANGFSDPAKNNNTLLPPGNPYYVIKGEGDFVDATNYQNTFKLPIGKDIATGVTNDQGEFELEFHLEDSLGYLVNKFNYASTIDQTKTKIGEWQCEEKNKQPIGNDLFTPGSIYNLQKGQSQPSFDFNPNTTITTKQGGGENLWDTERFEQLKQVVNLANCDFNAPFLSADFGMVVLRLVVDNPYYCSPDQDIIILPGTQTDLGTLTSLVKAYALEVTVQSDQVRQQQAGQQQGIPNVKLNALRSNVGAPAAPADEGDGLNAALAGSGATLVAKGVTGAGGKYNFHNLVRSKIDFYDHHIIQTGTTHESIGKFSYLDKAVKFQSPPAGGLTYNSEYNYLSFTQKIILSPDTPAFTGVFRDIGEQDAVELPGVMVKCAVDTKEGKKYLQAVTGSNGFFWINAFAPEEKSEGKNQSITGPKYDFTISKEGYKTVKRNFSLTSEFNDPKQKKLSKPKDDSLPKPVPIWGEVIDLSLAMEPLGLVRGKVEDENHQPVEAWVKIGDGALAKTYYGTAGFENLFVITSTFQFRAEALSTAQLIILPVDNAILPDTFVVNTSASNYKKPPLDLGVFTLKSKKHRALITVQSFDGPVTQAKIELGGISGITDAKGQKLFEFSAGGTEFPVHVEAPGFVPVDTFLIIPVSNKAMNYTIYVETGCEIKGTVTANNLSLSGARIYCELGSSSNAGLLTVETFSDANGMYLLKGVPFGTKVLIKCVKTNEPDKTYLGVEKWLTTYPQKDPVNNTLLPFLVDFNLSVHALAKIPAIWGFKVEVEKLTPVGQDYELSGALVQLASNENFVTDANLRIPFTKLRMINDNVKKILVPKENIFNSDVSAFPATLFKQYEVNITSVPNPNFPSKITVNKIADGQGAVYGLPELALYNFKTEFDLTGKFYLTENTQGFSCRVLTSVPWPAKNFYLTGSGSGPQKSGQLILVEFKPQELKFKLGSFSASSPLNGALITKDGLKINTYLHTNIPDMQPADLNIALGHLLISPNEVKFPAQGSLLQFNLGKWQFKSTANFTFDLKQGGLNITEGALNTGFMQVNLKNITITPDKIIANSNVQEFNLGGVAKFFPHPDGKAFLDYDSYNKMWSLVISGPGGIAGHLEKLPGFDKEIQFKNILLTSDNFSSTLLLAENQKFILHNFFPYQLADNGVSPGTDNIQVYGQMDLMLPGIGARKADFMISRENNVLVKKIQAITLDLLNLPGHVNYYYAGQGVTLSDAGLIAPGKMVVKEHAGAGAPSFEIASIKFERSPSKAELTMVNEPLIVLNGNQGFKIVKGKIAVNSGMQKWDYLNFSGYFSGYSGLTADPGKQCTFEVTGSMTMPNPSQIQVDNISTPFGNLALTYNFQDKAFTGNLTTESFGITPLSFDKIEASVRIDPSGFVFWGSGPMFLPPIGKVDAALLIGSTSQLYPGIKTQLNSFSINQKNIPNQFYGIGLIAKKTLLDEGVDLGVFSIDASAVVQASGLFDFKSLNVIIEADAIAKVVAKATATVGGVGCSFCLGINGVVGISAETGNSGFNFSACGTQSLVAEFKCLGESIGTLEKTCKISGSGGTSGFDLSFSFGGGCPGFSNATNICN